LVGTGFSRLPCLTSLIADAPNFSNKAVIHLPRGLTRLRFSCSNFIESNSFGQLPKSLLICQLNMRKLVSPQDIVHFPPLCSHHFNGNCTRAFYDLCERIAQYRII
jgi:hypothetical protein